MKKISAVEKKFSPKVKDKKKNSYSILSWNCKLKIYRKAKFYAGG